MIGPQTSVAETYELVWSDDPALDKDAHDFDLRWKQAIDGMLPWHSVCKPGAVPTVFVMRAIPGSKWRKLMRVLDGTDRGAADDAALMFKVSLADIKNPSRPIPMKFGTHPDVGIQSADDSVIDRLDEIHPGIVTQLGFQAFHRANVLPKP